MKSFTTRLTWRFAILVTTTMTLVLVTGGWLLRRQTIREIDLTHAAEARELSELLGDQTGLTPKQVQERVERDTDSDASLFFIQIDDDHGGVLFRSANLGSSLLPPAETLAAPREFSLPGLGDLRLASFSSRGPWRIIVGSLLAPTRQMLQVYAEVSAAMLGVAALASIALGYTFSRASLRPLQAIEATARRIGVSNLHERIPLPPGQDALVSVSMLLNETFDRLQASFEQVSRFTADASHELKTPLTLIRLNAEKLRRHAARHPESVATLDDMLEETARLHDVIDRLLFLARAEGGGLVPALQSIRAEEFVAEFAADAQALAEDAQAAFVTARSDAGQVRVEPVLLRQLLLNLVGNAVSVTPAGRPVTLVSALEGDRWRLTVIDEGPGLPEDQLGRIFGRFVRFTSEPGNSRPGHGLGLAISQSIAKLHHGCIRAENRADRSGLRLVVDLPADGG